MNKFDPNSIIHWVRVTPYVSDALSWIAFGLCAGVVAKVILPGEEKLGWTRTIIVGGLGAFIGGVGAAYLGINLRVGWNILGFAAAVAGSIVCLIINRVVTRS